MADEPKCEKKTEGEKTSCEITLGPTGFSKKNKIVIGGVEMGAFTEKVTVVATPETVTKVIVTLNEASLEAYLESETVVIENKKAIVVLLKRLTEKEKKDGTAPSDKQS